LFFLPLSFLPFCPFTFTGREREPVNFFVPPALLFKRNDIPVHLYKVKGRHE
jgi:hypothetical protein